MVDREVAKAEEPNSGSECPHAQFCRSYYFNFNGTLVCLVCDQTDKGERDPDALPRTVGTPH